MKYGITILLTWMAITACAQTGYKMTYKRYSNDQEIGSQDPIVVFSTAARTVLSSVKSRSEEVKYPSETVIIDWTNGNKLYRVTQLTANKSLAAVDSSWLKKQQFTLSTARKKILGYTCKKATTSINSNTIELWYTDELGIAGGPTELGQGLGLVLEYVRNGNSRMTATSLEKIKQIPADLQVPPAAQLVDPLTYQDALWKHKFLQISIFTNQQINFTDQVSSDSILRFASGTVILKKVKIPAVDAGSQAFIGLVEKSNGDAYDRTGSVFLIAEDQKQSFLDGMRAGMETLPMYTNGDGKQYPGMVRTDQFSPIYELMRFFTPFGVSHFNDRLTLKNKTWQDSAIYRQDITEFLPLLAGKEVYIGTYIGNYDKGGHTVSLELTIHPGDASRIQNRKLMSLFTTTNVMEMGGQEYPSLFGQEQGLEITFELAEDAKDVQLRYLTTGHGGWSNGDEFVPKENHISLDGKSVFKFTPWRSDCGSYRLYNPVSGNFNNGLSSSDLSRSNWCPGTVTTPNYIQLGDLKAGKHSIKVQIPQGKPEGNSLSFWNVSGALLYN